MALILPEIKHEYLFHLDTEETKNSVFDQCRAEGKEAAYSTFGTAQNDSEYQPAPTVEPDYYMQYCSSDGYDYLKDYRLVWGYGIGIIEQDVICSLTTGEHLAEGKEACDAYATENAAGENVDWKRGIWLKFSGNRNNSPARIGEVVLPDYIISLKDLCSVFSSTGYVEVNGFNTEHIINMNNMFYNDEQNVIFRIGNNVIFDFNSCRTAKKSFYQVSIRNENISFVNLKQECYYDYMFQRASLNSIPAGFSDNQNIGGIGMFYNARIYETVDNINMKLYSYMFCVNDSHGVPNTIHFGNNCQFNNCSEDISYAFKGTYMTDDITINYTNARIFDNTFDNVTFLKDNTITIDLSSIVAVESANHFFNNQFNRADTTNFIIIAPNCKFKGTCVFTFSQCNVNIDGVLKYYDLSDIKQLNLSLNTSNSGDITETLGFIQPKQVCITGTIQGIGLFFGYQFIYQDNKSSIVVINEELEEYEYVDLLRYLSRKQYIPYLIYTNGYVTSSNSIIGENISKYFECLNLDNYFFIANLYKQKVYRSKHGVNTDNVITINVNKKDKCFAILYPTNPFVNINIETNNNSKIFYTTTLASALPQNTYTDLFTQNYRQIILNIDKTDSGIGNIYYVEDYKTDLTAGTNYYGGIMINSPDYNIVNYEDSEYDTDINRITNYVFCFDNINNIDLKKYVKTTSSCCLVTIKGSGNIDISNINIANTYNMYDTRFLISKDVTIHTYYKDTEYNLPVFVANELSIITQDNCNFPFIYDENNNYAYCCINTINNCDTINASQLFKFIGSVGGNKLNNLDIVWNNTVNWDLDYYDIVKSDTEPELTSFRFNSPTNYNLTIDYVEKDITSLVIGNWDDNTNFSLNTLTIGNILSRQNGSMYLYYITDIVNINAKTLYAIYFYECSKLKSITINSSDSITYNIKSLYVDEMCANLEDITINNYENCEEINLSICSKLTQQSINNIVIPTLYKTGATLTIHTTPFQYITEEQKQALVNAGVTLVEYIPQTE